MKLINKNTKIYCSFSSNPGNNGCTYFNNKFQENEVNAIYKSFYSDDLKKSVQAVRTLGIAGFAVSMPFKVEVLEYVDSIDTSAKEIGAANTIINTDGHLRAHNTDWLGVKQYFADSIEALTVVGNGGFSKAVQYFCKKSNIPFKLVTRENWKDLHRVDGYVFNATPVDVETTGVLVDARPFTAQGKLIAELQAYEQYKLYTNE
jgi:shikimate dehydrogenase